MRDGNGSLDVEREVPKNVEAEQRIIGWLLRADAESTRSIDKLLPEMFWLGRHRTIMRVIRELSTQGSATDIITVANRISELSLTEEAGGRLYLNELLTLGATALRIDYYISIIEDDYIRRRAIELSGELIEMAYDEERDLADVRRSADAAAKAFAQTSRATCKSLIEYADETLPDIEAAIMSGMRGITTGYKGLDRLLEGFSPGVYVLAGRPGQGKSTLALDMAARQAGTLNPITQTRVIPGIISLEMSGKALTSRMISRTLGRKANTPPLGSTKEAWAGEVRKASMRLADNNIQVADLGSRQLHDVVSTAHYMFYQAGVNVLYIDYVQLIRDGSRRREKREEEVAAIMGRLVQLRHELDIPVVVLAQLNREVDRRENKLPMLSDLRESGSLEQDADVVMFTYDPAAYKKEGPHQIIVAKNRENETGIAYLVWNRPAYRFTDCAREPDEVPY